MSLQCSYNISNQQSSNNKKTSYKILTNQKSMNFLDLKQNSDYESSTIPQLKMMCLEALATMEKPISNLKLPYDILEPLSVLLRDRGKIDDKNLHIFYPLCHIDIDKSKVTNKGLIKYAEKATGKVRYQSLSIVYYALIFFKA